MYWPAMVAMSHRKVMWLCSVFALQDQPCRNFTPCLLSKLCHDRRSLAAFTERKRNDIFNWLKLRLTRPWPTHRRAGDDCKCYFVRVRSPLSKQNKVVRTMVYGKNAHLRVNTLVRGEYFNK